MLGVVAAAAFVTVFLTTRERVLPPPQQRSAVRQDMLDLLHNRPWMVLFALALVPFWVWLANRVEKHRALTLALVIQ